MLLEFSTTSARAPRTAATAASPAAEDVGRRRRRRQPGNLKWEIARVLLIVGLVLGAVMGVAWWLGQMVDAQDVDEALG